MKAEILKSCKTQQINTTPKVQSSNGIDQAFCILAFS